MPREVANWSGRYSIEDEPGGGDCRVLDISAMGVGLELFGAVPDDLIGSRIEVSVPNGTSSGIRLVGDVRNMSPGRNGGARAGVEFSFPSSIR